MRYSFRPTMAKQAEMVFASLMLLLCYLRRSHGATILNGPVNLSATPGQWANFTCTVACTHDIDWFVEGYQTDITEMCSDTRNNMMVCTQTTQECTQSSTTGFSKQLSLLAKDEISGSKIAVQCVAVSRTYTPGETCIPFIEYSRFAFLNVESLPTPEPSPVVCPTTTVSSVESQTVTETVTQPVLVSTVEVPLTVVVTVTADSPSCTPTLSNTVSAVRRTHLNKVLTELLTWLCTLLTGLAFL